MNDSLKELLKTHLANAENRIPNSASARLSRTFLTGMRTGRLLLFRKHFSKHTDAEIDLKALSKIVGAIGELKGIAMKMGQIMSYVDIDLPDELRDALSILRTHSQPMPLAEVRTIIQDELGERSEILLQNLSQTPIAAASIGQVHRATLPSGEEVAVKVQYPGIRPAIENDFKATGIAKTMGALFFPEAHIENFIDEAKERFLEECDYAHEAEAQKEFAGYYKDHAILHVPDVIQEYSSSNILATSFVPGLGFDEWLAEHPSQEVRNRIGVALFEFYLGTLYRFGLYNCDPHPGNYIFMPDDRIAVLDHGCTRRFEPAFRTKLKALTQAIYDDHRPSLHQALLDLDIIKEGRSYDYETIRSFLRSFHGPMLENRYKKISLGETLKLTDIMAMKQKLMKFQLPAESLFLFRIRFGLMSVLARLGAEANWHQLERSYIEKSV